ncbi:hypothetical protein [Kordia sp.]
MKKTKVLKFYQMETLLGGIANTTCTEETTPVQPRKIDNSPRRG